jgi:hypothetical protein
MAGDDVMSPERSAVFARRADFACQGPRRPYGPPLPSGRVWCSGRPVSLPDAPEGGGASVAKLVTTVAVAQ